VVKQADTTVETDDRIERHCDATKRHRHVPWGVTRVMLHGVIQVSCCLRSPVFRQYWIGGMPAGWSTSRIASRRRPSAGRAYGVKLGLETMFVRCQMLGFVSSLFLYSLATREHAAVAPLIYGAPGPDPPSTTGMGSHRGTQNQAMAH
jgi:hypothetical protein